LAENLAEADRRKSEFLATLAHELRNPLAPIRNGLGILRVGGDDGTASLAKTREMMERQVNHMVHLVDDLLDISRISGGKIELKKEPITIKQLITNAVETSIPLIENGQHKLIIDISDDSLSLFVDPNRVAQVISNLLNNAAKYTPPGGQIKIHVAVENNEFILSVEDNGIGIPAEALPTIFEMFNQVDRNMVHAQGGLGIGLALVRQIVEMHGGTVGVTSTKNEGSVFVIKIPIIKCDATCPAINAMDIKANSKSLRIMVVDDNVDAAQSLSLLLQFGGHTLFVAHDGHEAIKIARGYKPHIAFLDIGMPGMDGYETASAIRKIEGLEGMILVALTGWGAEEDKNRSREAGFNNHLVKPAQFEAIESLLSALEPTFQ
jgi:CheY-like chemotaxis protein